MLAISIRVVIAWKEGLAVAHTRQPLRRSARWRFARSPHSDQKCGLLHGANAAVWKALNMIVAFANP